MKDWRESVGMINGSNANARKARQTRKSTRDLSNTAKYRCPPKIALLERRILLATGTKVRGYLSMKNERKPLEVFAVIQFGGTRDEQYLHTFLNHRSAAKYIKSASRASYQCLGPFPISLPQASDLIASARRTVRWLKKLGLGKDPQTCELVSALANLNIKA
jgi:hypothetical protein